MESNVKKIIERGFRCNSMYEPNTLVCDTTEEEMERFCTQNEALAAKI